MKQSILQRFLRLGIASFGAVALIATSIFLDVNPAAAAVTSEPVAIAVGRSGDQRVLQIGGDGKSNGSQIVMAPYAYNTDTASSKQRWTLERVTGPGMPVFAYRVKNPATGKCLNSSGATPQNKAPIIIWPCNGTLSGTNEIWWVDSDPDLDGVHIRNKRDNRCLDITGASTANNAPVQSFTCVETQTVWQQQFKARTANFDCTIRNSEWQVTAGLCISYYFTPGIIGSWFNASAELSYRDPEDYFLSNELRSRLMANVINPDSIYSGNVQIGWRAARTSATGPVNYNAFWQEYGQNTEEYHSISTLDANGYPNGSGTADGAQHTYMMLDSATPNQWDLFYDFNFIATTARQSGSRANFVRADVQSRYIDALTQSQPYEIRVQTMNIAGTWAKPNVISTALGNNKECGMFPTWEDFTAGAGDNQPPWCLTTRRTLTNDNLVNTTTIGKPTTPVSLNGQDSGPRAAAPKPLTSHTTVNGVDQTLLQNCILSDSSNCLRAVPGLQQCVQRHLLCHASTAARPNAAQRTQIKLTAADARRVAGTLIISASPPHNTNLAPDDTRVTATTLANADLTDTVITGFPTDTPVFVISNTAEPIRSWDPNSHAVYRGWTTIIDAATGSLLYTRLGFSK